MRVVLPLALASVLAVVPTAPAGAQGASTSRTILVSGEGQVASIGRLQARNSLARAKQLFGKPSSQKRRGDTVCTVRWSRIGLRISFVTFGGGDPCRLGHIQTGSVTKDRFTTTAGLAAGMASSEIRTRHPDARFRQGSWWIATTTFAAGATEDDPQPTVRAITKGGRITALSLFVGAAGD